MRLLADDEVFPFVTKVELSAHGINETMLCDVECGPALRVYLALTEGKVGADLTPEDRFYNRYYWFRRFANQYAARFGEDAGVEQQAFQILEQAGVSIDGALIYELHLAAQLRR